MHVAALPKSVHQCFELPLVKALFSVIVISTPIILGRPDGSVDCAYLK